MSIYFPDNDKDATAAAMADPQPGDRFTEMYAFYVVVVRRDGDDVVFMELNPPCTVPHDGKVGKLHVEDFRRRFTYNVLPGCYWVRLVERGMDVSGWEWADGLDRSDELDDADGGVGRD